MMTPDEEFASKIFGFIESPPSPEMQTWAEKNYTTLMKVFDGSGDDKLMNDAVMMGVIMALYLNAQELDFARAVRALVDGWLERGGGIGRQTFSFHGVPAALMIMQPELADLLREFTERRATTEETIQ